MRARQPHHWVTDLVEARDDEATVRAALTACADVVVLADNTAATDREDFTVRLRVDETRPLDARIEVKSKRRRYQEPAQLWPEVPERDLFVLDELAYRRMLWTGGVVILVVHDHVSRRWLLLNTWDLLLCPKHRYARPGQRHGPPFMKGKLLIPLSASSVVTSAPPTGEQLCQLAGTTQLELNAIGQVARVSTPAREHKPRGTY